MATLSEYLGRVVRRRFAYGDLDCCTLMADWLMLCGFPDPMADRRGSYSTRSEYIAAIQNEGDIVKSCGRRFAAIGLQVTSEPKPGDVCLVKAPVVGPAGAIYVSDKFRAVITPDAGLVFAPVPVLRAWSVKRA